MSSEDERHKIDEQRKFIREYHSEPGPSSHGLMNIVERLLEIGTYEAAFAITEAWDWGDVLDAHVGFVLYLLGDDGKKACIKALEGDTKQFDGSIKWLMHYGDESAIDAFKKIASTDEGYRQQKAIKALGHIKKILQYQEDSAASRPLGNPEP